MAERMTIADVPKVGFWPSTKCPEDMPFAACMRALAQYLRDKRFGCYESRPEEKNRSVPCANKFFVGLSGIGFAMGWKWELGGFNVLNLEANPEPHIKRCFDALGLRFSLLANPGHPLGSSLVSGGVAGASGDEIRKALVSSIDRGMPCIAFGVFPPPEACLVTGYEGAGEVLIGSSPFQDFPEWKGTIEYEKSGYFRRTKWLPETAAVLIPGERLRETPSLEALTMDAVRAGLQLMERSDTVGGYAGGIRGYQEFIDALRDESAFPSGDDSVLRKRFDVVNGIAGDIAEARCYAADFLGMAGRGCDSLVSKTSDAAAQEAARERIERVIGRFLGIHDLMWRVWEEERGDSVSIGWPVTEHRYIGRPAVRERIARLVEASREKETQAHDYLAEAVRIIDGAARPDRLSGRTVLSRAPYVGFDASRTGGRPKTTYMAAALESMLAAVGEEYPYHFIMGVSGAAFRLSWNAERWDGGNISTLCMDDDPLEHYRRAFAATGWNPRFLGNRAWRPPVAESDRKNEYMGVDYLGDKIDYSGDEKEFRDLVRWGVVDRQYPLLTIGTLLPPEAGIVCGYDARENALIGYHHFQIFPGNMASPDVSTDADGRFVKRNWFADTIALVGLQHKGPKPPLETTYREALKTALRLIRTPRFRRHCSGLAAYRAWAEAMGGAWGDEVLGSRKEMELRLMCQNDAIACLVDSRSAARDFMREAATVLPGHAQALEDVARLCDEVAAVARRLIAIQGGFRGEAAPFQAIAKPEKRSEIAAAIREAAGIEERVAAALEPLCSASP